MIFQHSTASHLLIAHNSFCFKKTLFSSSQQAPHIPLECAMKIIWWLISQKICLYNLWYFSIPPCWQYGQMTGNSPGCSLIVLCHKMMDDMGRNHYEKMGRHHYGTLLLTVSAYDEWWSFTYTCQLKYNTYLSWILGRKFIGVVVKIASHNLIKRFMAPLLSTVDSNTIFPFK